jgi:hypothetical protein
MLVVPELNVPVPIMVPVVGVPLKNVTVSPDVPVGEGVTEAVSVTKSLASGAVGFAASTTVAVEVTTSETAFEVVLAA